MLRLACRIRAGGRALKLISKRDILVENVECITNCCSLCFRILRFVRVQLTVYISLRETKNMALNEMVACTRKVMGKYYWTPLRGKKKKKGLKSKMM